MVVLLKKYFHMIWDSALTSFVAVLVCLAVFVPLKHFRFPEKIFNGT